MNINQTSKNLQNTNFTKFTCISDCEKDSTFIHGKKRMFVCQPDFSWLA